MSDIEELAFEEEDMEDGFIDSLPGKTVATFTFDTAANVKEVDNRRSSGKLFGVTPAVEGEDFLLMRTYKFRKSTLHKLNELKALSQDENIYLSTIVDEAIINYYKYIKEKLGN